MINCMTKIVGKNITNSSISKEFNIENMLTQRKMEHIVLAALGYTNQEIAETLYISKSTVKKTFEDIFKKLDAKDRTNLVHKAWALGVLNSSVEKSILKKYNIMDKFV